MIRLSAEETILVAQLIAGVTFKNKFGRKKDSISTEDALNLFQGAKLPDEVLLYIFSIANKEEGGYLDREDLGVVVRLIGWAQIGVQVSWAWVHRCGPTAVIGGLPVLRQPNDGHGRLTTDCIYREDDAVLYPPFSAQLRGKFLKLFLKHKPVGDVLNAQHVWSVFLLSKLPSSTLADIWDLADIEDSGDLTLTEFLIAMYFVDGLMHQKFAALPTNVPSHIYEQAVHPVPDEPEAGPSVPRLYRNDRQRWAIRSALRSLHKDADGRITKKVFMNHLYEQYFVEEDGLRIWDLVDVLQEGTISQDEYTVALFFMHRVLVGIELPESLPAILIPPSTYTHPRFQTSSSFNTLDDGWEPKSGRPADWHICESLKSNAARIFSVLDFEGRDYVKQEPVIMFMKESKLASEKLTQIWSFMGLAKKRHIRLPLFTVILFFIHWCLAGQELPEVLPETLEAAAASSSPSNPNRHTIKIEPSMLSSVQDCRNSLRELTTENQRLRQQRQSLTNHSTSICPSIFTTPARTARPSPRPISVPLSELDAPFQSDSLEASVSSADLEESANPIAELRTEVEQLRATIQSLMVENATLRNSVSEIQLQATGRGGDRGQSAQRLDNSLTNLNVVDVEDLLPPPPYEEWISDV
ncbi:hypothetical protein D9758_007123 [Tetrapyrgos nigripes]|uniref:EH domain-containing protein n=1 Tax=Tetrapyrgos nigripes TaxID=182062 RepID=A0A8H5GDK1_9AGAR|nr:hypothetical protein D9758_007123 [Tetrapyrgos nigripes]